MKALNDPTGNRIHDLPACSAVRLHTRLYIIYKTVFVSQELQTRRRCEGLRLYPTNFTHQEFVNKLFKRVKNRHTKTDSYATVEQAMSSPRNSSLFNPIHFFSTVNYCIFTFRFLSKQVFYYVHLQQNSEGLSSFGGGGKRRII